MAELAYATDLKSVSCGFESHSPYEWLWCSAANKHQRNPTTNQVESSTVALSCANESVAQR